MSDSTCIKRGVGQRRKWVPIPIQYPQKLPISKRCDEIIEAIRRHPVIILSGETGSGKTTQIPKMCLDAGRGRKMRIACTQPRRVAALSIAKRVSEELRIKYGREVGSKIRFSDETSQETRIKFLTDGMLLAEIQSDPSMSEYDTIIIDEAHERSLNIDFLLGYLNQLRKRRPDLKVIVTSATIDIEKFSNAFDSAPIIEVSGRVHPVKVVYAPLDELLEDSGEFTVIDGVAESIERIINDFKQGDILVFLPTEKDISETRDLLEGRLGNRFDILPCFGRLSSGEQQRIFAPSKYRKIVLATNIAETSLTIPGIRFVVDSGLARTSRYNPKARTKRLPIEKISQSSANQRKGRCGRVQDGICIRLYSESDFEKRVEFSVPEIQRSNLAEVILRMEAAKLGDIETFPFIDPPSTAAIKSGYALLQELGAIDGKRKLTPIGRKLAKLPIDPTAGRMLLQAEREGVVEQVLVIASALSIQDPRERPMGKEEAARTAHKRFVHRESDFLTLLNIWESAHEEFERLTQNKLRKFCKKHFLSYLRVREWIDVKNQLSRSLAEFETRHKISHRIPEYKNPLEKSELRKFGGLEYRSIHISLATGLLANPGRKEEPNIYLSTGNRKAMIFPGSGLFNRKALYAKSKSQKREAETKSSSPSWILAGEIVETRRLYARTVAAIDPTWLVQIGGSALKNSYSQPGFDTQQGRVTCIESIRIHGLELQRKTVSHVKINSEEATEIFIREALLNEDYPAPCEFVEANRKLKNRIQNAQTTLQMQSWIGIEEAAYRYYERRLENIGSLADLNRWLKKAASPSKDTLIMSEKDLSPNPDEPLSLAAFPESVSLDNMALPIDYQYKPGENDDGVTLRVPYEKAEFVDDPTLDWLVPGHLESKILHLLKSLPKEHRRKLQPLSQTAATIASKLDSEGLSLKESLKKHLESDYKIETYDSDWVDNAIPRHLQVRVQVHDSEGTTVIEERSARRIHEIIDSQKTVYSSDETAIVEIWKKARKQWDRPIRELSDLKPCEEKVAIDERNGIPVIAFFTLRISSGELRLTLVDNLDEARAHIKKGIERLIEIELRRELAWIQEDLRDLAKIGPVIAAFAPIEEVKRQAYNHLKRFLCTHNIVTIDPNRVQEAISKAKSLSRGLAYKLIGRLKEILDLRQSLIVNKRLPKYLSNEVVRIAPPDLLERTPYWAFNRLPLYLETITIRQTSRDKDPQRDEKRQSEIDAFRKRLEKLQAQPEIKEDLAWTIEEYALSVFAQKLGTAFPVSAKRIEAKFRIASESISQQPSVYHQSEQVSKIIDKPTDADLQSLKSLFH